MHGGERLAHERHAHAGWRIGSVPQVILHDLRLPKVDGMVVFTSPREERDIGETWRLGVNSYIQAATRPPGPEP